MLTYIKGVESLLKYLLKKHFDFDFIIILIKFKKSLHLCGVLGFWGNRIAETNNTIDGAYVKSTSVSGTNTDGGANPNANDILFDPCEKLSS